MNAHLPQSETTAAELEEIAAVPLQIITPRHAKPVIGVVQDALAGSYRLTRPGVTFNRREFMNLMMYNRRYDGAIPAPKAERARFTGQQVMSQLMPPLNLAMGNKSYDEKDSKESPNYVKIHQGEILQGTLDDNIFGKAGKGIIHTTFNDYGPKQTVELLDAIQSTVESFLVLNGFSVGISDLVADETTKSEVEKIIAQKKKEVEQIMLQVHLGLFDNNTGKTNQQEFEDQVFRILNGATDSAGGMAQKSLSTENRLISMINAGSKGNKTNIAQMVACLGQQAIEGKRITYGFTDRTLPHYKKYDDSAEARGFVESSFIRGLSPQEFFFHAMGGREGLIDTAVKTAETGYIQRQLIKALEDLVTQHDGTVRDAAGNVLQFHYGEDGTAATMIESQSVSYQKMSRADIRRTFGLDGVDWSQVMEEGLGAPSINQEALRTYVDLVLEDQRIVIENVGKSNSLDSGSVQAPVNLARCIMNTKIQFGLTADGRTDLTPDVVLAGIARIIERTAPHNRVWQALLRFYLAPHNIILKERFTRRAFDTLTETLVLRHMKSWAQPGEQVGIIAAQSIGEPSTQMSNLKSTVIYITDGFGENFYGTVGEFVDRLLEANPDRVVNLGNDSVVSKPPKDYYIVGVSDSEKTSWRKISEISRHPANGGMVRITTRTGRKTTATLSHSFLTRAKTGVIPILGSDLRVGMRVPVARKIAAPPGALEQLVVDGTVFNLTKDFGWLCGIYLADGSLGEYTTSISKIHPAVEENIRAIVAPYSYKVTVRNYQGEYGPSKSTTIHSAALKTFMETNFGTGSYTKRIGANIMLSNTDFVAGLLGGYFDGDGNANVTKQNIRVGSRSERLIKDISKLLARCSVFATICQETSVRIPGKVMYTLQILKRDAEQFAAEVGFRLPEKAAALAQIIAYNGRTGKHDDKELIDKIPQLGEVIAETGRLLKMPGQSRMYGRWQKKESVGRRTLANYMDDFTTMAANFPIQDATDAAKVAENFALLRQALDADVVWDEIVDLEILEDPKEYVYDFTVPGNDSFLVDENILVHNTLNSVDWDEKIMIARDGKIVCPQIGEFIDDYLKTHADRVKTFPNNQLYLEMDAEHKWEAVSCDADGKMKWTRLEAVTKHPVVNADGTNTILEVELECGRKVKATKGKSFLTVKDGKLVDTNGSDLTVGDALPLATTLATNSLPEVTTFDLKSILPATKWIYGDEVERALAVMKSADEAGQRHWFSANNGTGAFTVPYSRSDAFRDAFANGHNSRATNGYFRKDCVYPKSTRSSTSHIPAILPLDRAFGYLAGAYLAEGSSSSTQIQITNSEEDYLQPIEELLKKWSVGYHITKENKVIENTGIQGFTQSLVIHSTLLTEVLTKLFGEKSYVKTMPDWVFQAPDEFVKGLVDGYIGGDGCVSSNSLSFGSVSEDLIIRMGTLLVRYGLVGRISSYMPELRKFKSVARFYKYTLSVFDSFKFAEIFTLTLKLKQERLNAILERGFSRFPSREVLGEMWLSKIKSIRDIPPLRGEVYDLTVAETRNFLMLNTLACRDTFHLAGVASKSNVTRGVPRLRELLKVTKNPKATSLMITLKKELRGSKDHAREVQQDLELTTLKMITNKASIFWEPTEENVNAEDKDWVRFNKLIEASLAGEEETGSAAAAGEGEEDAGDTATKSNANKWVIRLELNRETMFNKNISIQDVVFAINNRITHDMVVSYTDYNSEKLILRIMEGQGFNTDYVGLKNILKEILNNIVIRGIPGIKAVTFRKDNQMLEMTPVAPAAATEAPVTASDEKYQTVEQYVLDTDGSNYIAVMNHPSVDGTRLTSTNVHDIYEVLGIEATRETLMTEINSVFNDIGVNNRHFGLLADVMTRAGRLMSADRYGINKNEIGPLAKMSFEETEKIVQKASVFGEVDPVTGVSANIMMGQPIRGGTAFSQILLDEQALARLSEGLPPVEEGEEEQDADISDLVENAVAITDPCSTTQFQVHLQVPAAANMIEERDVDLEVI